MTGFDLISLTKCSKCTFNWREFYESTRFDIVGVAPNTIPAGSNYYFAICPKCLATVILPCDGVPQYEHGEFQFYVTRMTIYKRTLMN